MPDRCRQAAACVALPPLLTAAVLSGCMDSALRGGSAESARAGSAEALATPEELLLDVGIAVFDAPGPIPEVDAVETVFRNDEVLRAERNYLPYVIGEHLQASGTWGAVRVILRPSAALDVTVTGAITRSDGESLAFRAKATDARGVVWFDNEYRAVAESSAYGTAEEFEDPFAPAYAALAADMAASLRELTLDDRARVRAVAEVAFGHSLVPEAFARHVEPKPEGGHELRRLPAAEDPMLARVRDIRQREHLFIDQVNDYYDDFSAGIQGPYDEWRRKAFSSRRQQRDLKLKADAYVLLGSARIVAGLARMDHDLPGRLGFDWVARGMGLIRGAQTSEGQIRDNAESLREVGSATGANLLGHTTALENRTASLQRGVDSRFDRLRAILDRLYREEFGLPGDPSRASPRSVEEHPPGPATAASAAVDPLAEPASGVLSTTRGTWVERRTADAKEEIRAGNVQAAIDMLDRILDEGDELGALAAARVYALLALGHFAQADDRRALSAFDQVVRTACTNICWTETARAANERRRHFNPIRPTVYEFIAAAQEEIYYGDFDYAVDMLTDLVGNPLASPPSRMKRDVARSLGVFALRPSERAAAYQALARAHVGKRDYAAASAVYERILGMGSKVPPWHRDISNESLALIYFSGGDYKKSVEYQRAWLETSNWVGEACPKVCRSVP